MNEMIAVKCTNCSSNIVLNSTSINDIRCHWCGKELTIENKIDNAPIPTYILPFKKSKEEVLTEFNNLLNKRKFFVSPIFNNQVNEQSLRKVYLPYILVNLKAHTKFEAEAELTAKKNIVSFGDGKTATKYDVDLYQVVREYDLSLEKMPIEITMDNIAVNKLDKITQLISNTGSYNIDEAIPFSFDLLKDATAERRNVNVPKLQELTEAWTKDINKEKLIETNKQYDRGSKWIKNELTITKQQWQVVYLPVYIYNYYQNANINTFYLVVNGTTNEMVGYIPVNSNKIMLLSSLIAIVGIVLMILVNSVLGVMFLVAAAVFFLVTRKIYSNITKTNHKQKPIVKIEITNPVTTDVLKKKKYGISNERMYEANNLTMQEEKHLKKKLKEINNSNEKF